LDALQLAIETVNVTTGAAPGAGDEVAVAVGVFGDAAVSVVAVLGDDFAQHVGGFGALRKTPNTSMGAPSMAQMAWEARQCLCFIIKI